MNAVVVKYIYKVITSQSPQEINLGILILFKLLPNWPQNKKGMVGEIGRQG